MIAIPLVLSGCERLFACTYETRHVRAAGSVTEGVMEVASATVSVSADRGSLNVKHFQWSIRAPSLEGHVTSVVLVNSTQPAPILLDLPVREPITPFVYEGALTQRSGELSPALGGIFEIVAGNRAVFEITTDLPSRPLIRLSLTVTEKQDWYRPTNCF